MEFTSAKKQKAKKERDPANKMFVDPDDSTL